MNGINVKVMATELSKDYIKVLYDEDSKISIHSEICKSKSGPSKNVLLMTSMVPDVARTKDDTKKPYLVNVYNYSMGGTDR